MEVLAARREGLLLRLPQVLVEVAPPLVVHLALRRRRGGSRTGASLEITQRLALPSEQILLAPDPLERVPELALLHNRVVGDGVLEVDLCLCVCVCVRVCVSCVSCFALLSFVFSASRPLTFERVVLSCVCVSVCL